MRIGVVAVVVAGAKAQDDEVTAAGLHGVEVQQVVVGAGIIAAEVVTVVGIVDIVERQVGTHSEDGLGIFQRAGNAGARDQTAVVGNIHRLGDIGLGRLSGISGLSHRGINGLAGAQNGGGGLSIIDEQNVAFLQGDGSDLALPVGIGAGLGVGRVDNQNHITVSQFDVCVCSGAGKGNNLHNGILIVIAVGPQLNGDSPVGVAGIICGGSGDQGSIFAADGAVHIIDLEGVAVAVVKDAGAIFFDGNAEAVGNAVFVLIVGIIVIGVDLQGLGVAVGIGTMDDPAVNSLAVNLALGVQHLNAIGVIGNIQNLKDRGHGQSPACGGVIDVLVDRLGAGGGHIQTGGGVSTGVVDLGQTVNGLVGHHTKAHQAGALQIVLLEEHTAAFGLNAILRGGIAFQGVNVSTVGVSDQADMAFPTGIVTGSGVEEHQVAGLGNVGSVVQIGVAVAELVSSSVAALLDQIFAPVGNIGVGPDVVAVVGVVLRTVNVGNLCRIERPCAEGGAPGMTGATGQTQEAAVLGVVGGTAGLTVVTVGVVTFDIADLRGGNGDHVAAAVAGQRDLLQVFVELARCVIVSHVTGCVASFGNIVPCERGCRNRQHGNNHSQHQHSRDHSGKRPFHW